MVKLHQQFAKSEMDSAADHDTTNPGAALRHRDRVGLHKTAAQRHEAHQKDFEDWREQLAEASDAILLDNHSDAGDALRSAYGYSDLLKAMRLLPQD
jgi:hypothetical protein